jgi:NAD(P)-dependent dehydrogenase (short-subunit alcohol dehydrogenase family)
LDEHKFIEEFELKDLIIVITGAAGELCGMMSRALGSLGAKVALLDIRKEKVNDKAEAIRKEGGIARAFHCSVIDLEELKVQYENICDLWGEPHILINGAGGNHPQGSTDKEYLDVDDLGNSDITTFFDLSLEGFSRVFDLNFMGTFLPTQVFTQGMVNKKKGVILNISSMNYYTPLTKIPAYAAAKAAVSNFTAWLAVHFSRVGIRVNAIAPGFLMTEQLKFLHIDQKTGEYTDRAKKVIAHTPMGRYGKPEELVGTVIWLLSDASRFVTGITVPIDGGFSSYSI